MKDVDVIVQTGDERDRVREGEGDGDEADTRKVR